MTGGSGSWGQVFVRHLLRHDLAEKIVVYSRSEFPQARMREALGHDPRVKFIIGDVRDRTRIHDALYRVDTVVHAAAVKRIEDTDPSELYKTNVEGTVNVVRAAIDRGIAKVVLLSSDKSPAACTAYGASKQMAEHYATYANTYGHPRTTIACVRYGNVAGSRGSVIHLWRRQVTAGAPMTLTDDRCTRFWLSLDQAVALVLRTLDVMHGGEIIVPDLPAMRVADLANALAPGHSTKLIGLRAGEKLHECLVSEDESIRTVRVPGLGYVIEPAWRTWPYAPWRGEHLPAGQKIDSWSARQLTIVEAQALLAQVPDET